MSPSFRRVLVAGALWSSAAAAQSARIGNLLLARKRQN